MMEINYRHISFKDFKRSDVDQEIFYGDQAEFGMIELDLAMAEIFGGRNAYRNEIKRMVDEEENFFNFNDGESGHVYN